METNVLSKPEATFGGSYDHGWRVMTKYFLILLLVTFVVGVIMAPMKFGSGVNYNFGDVKWGNREFLDLISSPGFAVLGMFAFLLGMFALAYSLLVVPVFKYGQDLIFVHAARDQRPQFETLVMGFREKYLHIVLASLLVTALTMLGFIFFIVPGIIVMCRLAFTSYLVMDKKMDPIVAVEESWKLTRGHGWRIFAMGFVSVFISFAGLIMLIIGVIPAIMWIKSSFASLYVAVQNEKAPNGEIV